MNNYCIYLKKRKNKPFCQFINKEIPFCQCQHCANKKYKAKIKQNSFYKSNDNQIKKNLQLQEKKTPKTIKMCNKSKKLSKLERNRFSVFSSNIEKCYLCDSTYKLTWHEIYAGKNRRNSMKYGLCLRLCLNCHKEKQEDVQFNEFWHKQGQLYWEKNIGSRNDFIKVFRRNYLD